MIRAIIILVFVGLGSGVNAQYNSEGDTISRFRPGMFWFYSGIRPAKPEKPQKYDRLILDLTYNDWIGDREPFQNHWSSIGLNTNFIFDIPLTRKNDKVSFGVGVSHQFTSIRHNNHLVADDAAGTTTFVAKDSSDVFSKSMLNGNSFSIPIEFRFRTGGWRHFKFHIGGKIGYQANLFSKYVASVNGHREVWKRYDFPDEARLIYSAHIRIGMRNWALYASYNFNPLFQNSNSTRLNMIQAGLSLSLF